MKNFIWTHFTKRITIKSDLKSVYNAWTIGSELEKWFLSKAVFYSDYKKIIPSTDNVTVGNKYEWKWFAQDYVEHGTVIEANGTDYFEFTFAGECKVQVKLSKVKDQILVDLTQKEIPLDDESKEDIRLGCASGWAFYLVNLKSILEGGVDLRNKDVEIFKLVNS